RPCPSSFAHHPATTADLLSLHDALPISHHSRSARWLTQRNEQRGSRCYLLLRPPIGEGTLLMNKLRPTVFVVDDEEAVRKAVFRDRKSTRLNSSHVKISYAVVCLKKKTS